MKSHNLFAAVAVAYVLGSAAPARADVWNDGSPSRVEHECWQGIYPPIAEDLAWVYVGYSGQPKVGDTYLMRVEVAGFGCSGAWTNPEVRLPPNTQFAIDAAHPVRCFLGPYEAATQITDGNCPSQPSSTTSIGGGFVSFPPQKQAYWPLPSGKILIIEFPVTSTAVLSGIASANDFLLGGAQLLDQSPGNPVPSYDAPPAGYSSGIPSSGAWQGVFVSPAAASSPTNTWVVFPEPSAGDIHLAADPAAATQSVHVTLTAHVYYPLCFCDNNHEPLADGSGSCDNAGTSATVCCTHGGVVQHHLLSTILPTDSAATDTTYFTTSSGNGCTSTSATEEECNFTFGGLKYGVSYDYTYSAPPNAIYDPDTANGCAATGLPPIVSGNLHSLKVADPNAPVTYDLFVSATGNGTGNGTVTRAPDGGAYAVSTVVNVTAAPAVGSIFQKWVLNGVDQAATNPLPVTVTADTTLVAVFTTEAATSGGAGSTSGAGATSAGSGSSSGSSSGASASSSGGAAGSTAGAVVPTTPAAAHKGCSAAQSPFVFVAVVGLVLFRRRRR